MNDDYQSGWERILTSWTAVYIACLAPGVLLISNFLFGNCTLETELLQSRGSGGLPSLAARSALVVVYGSFLFQYEIYSRIFTQWRHNGAGSCDPLRAAAEYVSSLGVAETNPFTRCESVDLIFFGIVVCCLLLHISCLFSRPQIATKSSLTTFCRRCSAHILELDHHCVFIHNCVGKGNFHRFLAFTLAVWLDALFLLHHCGMWSMRFVEAEGLSVDGILVSLGAIWTLVSAVTLTFFLSFQLLLKIRNTTTRAVLRRKNENNWSWIGTLLYILQRDPGRSQAGDD